MADAAGSSFARILQIDFEFIFAQMHFGVGRHYYFTICMQMPVIPKSTFFQNIVK